MDGDASESGAGRQLLSQIIAEYLDALKAGLSPDRQELLDRHPDLAEDLRSFFADHDRVQELAELREGEALSAAGPELEAPTIPPGEAIGGAATIADTIHMLEAAGFENIKVSPKDESRALIKEWVPGSSAGDFVVSAIIEAKKPGA